MMETERLIWKGGPSHWRDLGFHLLCLLFSPLVFPIGMAIWRYFSTSSEQFEITSERIRMRSGVFSRRLEEMELCRVKDSSLEQPFLFRLVGLSNIVIKTSDATTPRIEIPAISDAQKVREELPISVEQMRDRKGVREVDFR